MASLNVKGPLVAGATVKFEADKVNTTAVLKGDDRSWIPIHRAEVS